MTIEEMSLNKKNENFKSREIVGFGLVFFEVTNTPEGREKIRSEIALCRGTGREQESRLNPGTMIKDCEEPHIDNSVEIDERLVTLISREFEGRYIGITSGYRCPEHNKFSVDDDESNLTKPGSLHIKGQAVDLVVLGPDDTLVKGLSPLKYEKKDVLSPLKYKQYAELIESLKEKYRFSEEDWELIYQNDQNRDDNDPDKKDLSNFPYMIFAKAYESHEGRDTDNKHENPYMHIDFRGIKPEEIVPRSEIDRMRYEKLLKNKD